MDGVIMGRKICLEEAKEIVRKTNRHADRITIEYEFTEKSSGKYKYFYHCRCSVCNYEWDAYKSNLLRKFSGCPSCSGILSLSFNEAYDVFKSHGYYLLSDYNGVSSSVSVCDADGYLYRTTLSNVRSGGKIAKFGKANNFSIYNIKNFININNKNFILMSDEFKSSRSLLEFKCRLHNEIFEMNTNKMQYDQGCPICGDGYYNIHNAETYKEEWKKINSMVYIIELFSKSEKFYKIGIAKNGLKARFNKRNMPYDYRVIKEIRNISQYDACYVETYLKKINSSKKYIPNVSFRGESECFSDISAETTDMSIEEILEYDCENSEDLLKFENKLINMFINGSSIRSITRQLGYKSKASISDIIIKKNNISKVVISRIEGQEECFKSHNDCANFFEINITTVYRIIQLKSPYKISKTSRHRNRFLKLEGLEIFEGYIKGDIDGDYEILKIKRKDD